MKKVKFEKSGSNIQFVRTRVYRRECIHMLLHIPKIIIQPVSISISNVGTDQSRTDQSRTEQRCTEVNSNKLNRAEQSRAEQSRQRFICLVVDFHFHFYIHFHFHSRFHLIFMIVCTVRRNVCGNKVLSSADQRALSMRFQYRFLLFRIVLLLEIGRAHV